VANWGSSSVTKFRASDGTNSVTYAVSGQPAGICFDGSNIWVANWQDRSVTEIRASDGANLGTYTVGTQPSYICYDGTNIWVTNNLSNSVTKLMPQAGTTKAITSTASGIGMAKSTSTQGEKSTPTSAPANTKSFPFVTIIIPLLFMLVLSIYLVPTLIALLMDKDNVLTIGLLNFFLGWSLIMWVICLVWALASPRNRSHEIAMSKIVESDKDTTESEDIHPVLPEWDFVSVPLGYWVYCAAMYTIIRYHEYLIFFWVLIGISLLIFSIGWKIKGQEWVEEKVSLVRGIHDGEYETHTTPAHWNNKYRFSWRAWKKQLSTLILFLVPIIVYTIWLLVRY
jgi:hypothetical protein